MPKTERDKLKRTLAQAYINIDWSGSYLDELEKLFREAHPELADALLLAQEGLTIIQETLTTFAQKAWEVEKPDWVSWAATGRPRRNILKDEELDSEEAYTEPLEPKG